MNTTGCSTRSENMRRIRSEGTSIEVLLRQKLWKKGLRYRKNDKRVFGTPDITFYSKKIAIFCDSEFWHGKKFLEGELPKTNAKFWEQKFLKNIERDKVVNLRLKNDGWIVLRYWEKDIRSKPDNIVNSICRLYLEK